MGQLRNSHAWRCRDCLPAMPTTCLCTFCLQNKKNTPERMELMKYNKVGGGRSTMRSS